MANVIDLSSRFIFKTLRNMSEQQRREIERNPAPYIRKASEEVQKMRGVIKELDLALNPMPEIITNEEATVRGPDIRTDAVVRVSKAREIINEWRGVKE